METLLSTSDALSCPSPSMSCMCAFSHTCTHTQALPFLCECDCNTNDTLRRHDCITAISMMQMKLRRRSHNMTPMQLKQHGGDGSGGGYWGFKNTKWKLVSCFEFEKDWILTHNSQNPLLCNLSIHMYLFHNASTSTVIWNKLKMQTNLLNNNPWKIIEPRKLLQTYCRLEQRVEQTVKLLGPVSI